MRNLKYTLEGMWRKPFIFFIMLIQVIIASVVLIQAMGPFFILRDTINNLEKLYDINTVYRLIQDSPEDDVDVESDKYIKKMKGFYDFAIKNNQFEYVFQKESNIIIKDFTPEKRFYYSKTTLYMENPYDKIYGKYSNIKGLYIDYKYTRKFPIEIQEGRGFQKEDFKNLEYNNVILGADYSDIYNVGDEFEYFNYVDKKVSKIKVIDRKSVV